MSQAIIIALAATITELDARVKTLQEGLDNQADDFHRRGVEIHNLQKSLAENEESHNRTLNQQAKDLSRRTEEWNQLYDDRNRLLDRVYELEAELRTYQPDSAELRVQANDWMLNVGQDLKCVYPGGEGHFDKIGCIKQVRQMTRMGLKESKAFVEAWMAVYPDACKDDPKGWSPG
jgi:regulator of replication initiation timing